MDWRTVPPLASLRAFEAAARRGGLSAAARELNVTHAAVAQQVRALEGRLGTGLLAREGRAMRPTEDGARLAARLTEAFGLIEGAVRELTEEAAARPLRVSLTISFAEGWLMSRLGRFWAEHPEVPLAIVPSPDLVDLRRDGFDVAIRYGGGSWPPWRAERLMPWNYVVVAAPALAGNGRVERLADLAGRPWLIDPWGNEQRGWAAHHGLTLDAERVTELPAHTLALAAAREGLGLAIQPEGMVRRDLESGALVALYGPVRTGPGSYHVLTRPDQVSARRDAFTTWLTRTARREGRDAAAIRTAGGSGT